MRSISQITRVRPHPDTAASATAWQAEHGDDLGPETARLTVAQLEARAATFRRIADDLRDEEDRHELQRVARLYEARAAWQEEQALLPRGSR